MMNSVFLFFIFHLIYWAKSNGTEVEPNNFLIYGPGLDPELVMPVRYIFIQLVDKNGKNVTDLKPNQYNVHMTAQFRLVHSKSLVTNQIHHEVFYIQLGVFVLRFKIINRVINEPIKITLTWLPTNSLIGFEPIILKSPMFSEKLYCPQMSLSYWLDTKLHCPSSYNQIDKDFSSFISNNIYKIDPEINYRLFELKYQPFQNVAVCRYKIIDNKIYRKCFGEHVGFRIFVDEMLISIIKKVKLQNIDFLFNLGDWPLSDLDDKFMIVSWCGSTDSNDIVVPTYETMEWVLGMMHSVNMDVFSVLNSVSNMNWESRITHGIWRGRDSSEARMKLVLLSIKKQVQVDARLTHMFFFPNNSKEYVGERVPHTPFPEFFKYKYLIHLDGTVAAYRLPLSLAGGSLILKQESKYYEFFHGPHNPSISKTNLWWNISEELTDLNFTLSKAIQNDEEAKRTGIDAVKFVHHNLMPHHVLCYLGRVLEKLGQVSTPSNYDLQGYESVYDSSDDSIGCPTNFDRSEL